MASKPRRPRTCTGSELARRTAAALAGLSLLFLSSGLPAAGTERSPEDIATMRLLALEYLRVENYEGSIELYRTIAREVPDDPRSHYELAGTLAFLRLYEEAVKPIETAIRLDPDDVRARDMAALIYWNMRRYDEAFAATLKCAELGEPTAMFSLMDMYEQGIGVSIDQDRAVYWAEQAADHGHLGAMATMEQAYRTGRFGRHIDSKRAEAWAQRLRDAQ